EGGLDVFVGGGFGDHEDFVACLEREVSSGDVGLAGADDGGNHGAWRQGDVGESFADGGGVRGKGGFDHSDAGGAEVDEVDGFGGAGGFLDERQEGCGRGNGDVDAPAFVEEPAVFRVVDASDDAGDVELSFGEQRDDEVVFVISGGGDQDVGLEGA